MAQIKSALEIALEKTHDVVGDKEKIEADAAIKDGKKIASGFLNIGGDGEKADLKEALRSLSGKKLEWAREGMLQVFLANIVLPFDESFAERLGAIFRGLTELGGDRKKLALIAQQLEKFFRQYLENKTKIREQLEQQYAPRLRQREAQLSQQVGAKVRVTPMQDPEFVSVLQKNFAGLEERYQEALGGLKDELRSMYPLGK